MRITLPLSAIAALVCLPAHAGSHGEGSWSENPDEGLWEIFIDSVEDYGGKGDLSRCIDGTDKYRDHMKRAGYTNTTYFTDGEAWASDFDKDQEDDRYSDASDFSYFSGHGINGHFLLHPRAGVSFKSPEWASWWEFDWGNNDAEVVALDACNVLGDNNGRKNMGKANLGEGVHMVMGFVTTALDVTTTADKYGYYLSRGYHVTSAWILATREGHGPNRTARYIRYEDESCDTSRDTAFLTSCDPTAATTYWYGTWTL